MLGGGFGSGTGFGSRTVTTKDMDMLLFCVYKPCHYIRQFIVDFFVSS